ncbi:diphosphomevalonate decarboxylase [Phytomonospora endophytica]|uniref:diphosphomevalonate decarboxylase n=1 Tax=Phytomonospora endophytica TaxID=714109 RepID=A0A841FS93_9ACTN|nr:diphosphomevalonate decarboxylase [Phytomonospora endophytica]MBB6038674.1 diphosphomevalonate decarboxylase [Phytomonospora endophytica]GIG69181.1 diphosphomevalonate decarboxylase [Phytomonospora endophytica]
MPVTAVAPANIAFIKYWGLADRALGVPANQSLSMTLSRCVSRCTVDTIKGPDEVWWHEDGRARPADPVFAARVVEHLDRLRAFAEVDVSMRIITTNSFPTAAGIASSASGFAALTLAALTRVDAAVDPGRLSILARKSGSGSAARSVLGGYVLWPEDSEDPASAATTFLPREHWALSDVIAVVDSGPKATSSREGHFRASTSPHFGRRVELLGERLQRVRTALRERDFATLAEAVEEEMYEMQAIATTSRPPLRYWRPGTLRVLERIEALRASGVPVCATTDAGPNVHALCPDDAVTAVAAALSDDCETIIIDKVGAGPALSSEHLGMPTSPGTND